jgi:hypothetical protein
MNLLGTLSIKIVNPAARKHYAAALSISVGVEEIFTCSSAGAVFSGTAIASCKGNSSAQFGGLF